MTFRTVVRDGLIVINAHGEIPDGTRVEVVLSGHGGAVREAPAKGSRRGKSKAPKVPEFGFGTWKHRKDTKDAAGFARSLRVRTSRHARRG